MSPNQRRVQVEGHELTLSNLDKILYPAPRYSKAQAIDYYVRISKFLLPHLKDRPVTLIRYPDGVRGDFFYEKDAPLYTPEWVDRFAVPRRGRGGEIHYILVDNLATLVWTTNIASLELHPFLHRVPQISRPTEIVFDFDPGPGMDILDCARVGLLVRNLLSELGLNSFAKVSGSKGVQIYVPLNSEITYELTEPFAKAIADLMQERHPHLIVSKMAKALRAKKVFIDWSQNSDFKTTVSVYSLRAKSETPYVSMPVSWNELSQALEKGDTSALYFGPDQALRRVQEIGDIFEPVLTLKQQLPANIVDSVKAPAFRNDSLGRYRAKRNFAVTPEPAANLPARSEQGSRRRFVIQKHAASHLHYDFRLEMHGVLKSWAVPKGLPDAPGTKRLAMATEDHPLEYLDFEGIIPAGQYGGGTVMVWDIGTYDIVDGNYHKGYLRVFLNGKKLSGEWTLSRSRENGHSEDGRDKWYVEYSGKPIRAKRREHDDESALTKRSMQQIARAQDREWQSNRAARTGTRPKLEQASRSGANLVGSTSPAARGQTPIHCAHARETRGTATRGCELAI